MNYDKKHRQTLLDVMIANGLNKATVDFSGSGDSGGVDEIYFLDSQQAVSGDDIKATVYQRIASTFIEGQGWVTGPVAPQESTLKDLANLVAFLDIDAEQVDWHNDGGGRGTWELTIANGDATRVNVELSIDQYVQETNNVAFFDRDRDEWMAGEDG